MMFSVPCTQFFTLFNVDTIYYSSAIKKWNQSYY